MAVFVVEVQSIADHEGVGDVEADIVRREGNLLAGDLVQEDRDADAGRPALLQFRDHLRQRPAGVEDVIDEEHILAGEVGQIVEPEPRRKRAEKHMTTVLV